MLAEEIESRAEAMRILARNGNGNGNGTRTRDGEDAR
jgi:hypothetical protein